MVRFLLLMLLSISTAFASPGKEPLMYAQTPLFYSTFTPKVAPCFFDSVSRQGACGWETWPEEIPVSVTRRGTDDIHDFMIRGNVQVVCIEERCVDVYGQLRGLVYGHSGITYWDIPRGYYLSMIDRKFTAIKFGNGSLKETFPIRDIAVSPYNDKKVDGDVLDEQLTQNLYNVYCNEDVARCSYLGIELTLFELTQIVPFVKTETCDEYLCYIDNKKSQVAGVNPKQVILYDGIK